MFVDDHVVTRAMWSKGLKACWHVSTRARKARWHVSTLAKYVGKSRWQSTLASEYMSTQDALAREQRLSFKCCLGVA